MEFVERFFGIKRRKQERLLSEMEITGKLEEELFGHESENALVVTIDNEKFLEILQSGEHKKVWAHLVHQSDTHQVHEFYIDVGEGIKAKTDVASVDYSRRRTLLSDLNEMSFKYNPEESKDNWSVYEVEMS